MSHSHQMKALLATSDLPASERAVASLAAKLMAHGRRVGVLLPWHDKQDAFSWAIAESLLRRTTRTAAGKAFSALTQAYPSWRHLAAQPPSRIAKKIAWVGLGTQRSRQLRELARVVITRFKGNVPRRRDELMSLPGIGSYIADAIILYVYGGRVFPIDPNVQRVIRRFFGLPTSFGTRHSDPYRDHWVRNITSDLIAKRMSAQVVHMHRGLLHIAWTSCRPRPNCIGCTLAVSCAFSSHLGATT
jgi:A/G-specific adenine glycosylase